jgi:hypothetical protein
MRSSRMHLGRSPTIGRPAKQSLLRKASCVIDFLPDSSTFAATIADPRFPLAIAISALAGVVRGFSGFGSALVYAPSFCISASETSKLA